MQKLGATPQDERQEQFRSPFVCAIWQPRNWLLRELCSRREIPLSFPLEVQEPVGRLNFQRENRHEQTEVSTCSTIRLWTSGIVYGRKNSINSFSTKSSPASTARLSKLRRCS